MSTQVLLAIGKAAELLNVSVKTLRRWSNAGKIPFIKTPTGHRRYRLEDIESLLSFSDVPKIDNKE